MSNLCSFVYFMANLLSSKGGHSVQCLFCTAYAVYTVCLKITPSVSNFSLPLHCRAQRGGVGFLFCGEAASSLPFPLRKGDRTAVDRVLSYIVDLRRISPLIFHPASTLSGSLRSPPSPRGEGLVRRYCFSTYACICSDNARKAVFSYRSLPHWGRGTAQRWIGYSRKRRT